MFHNSLFVKLFYYNFQKYYNYLVAIIENNFQNFINKHHDFYIYCIHNLKKKKKLKDN